MYNQNSEQRQHNSLGAPPMSPRISFSIDSQSQSLSLSQSQSQSQSQARDDPYRDSPVSSDFAFSVTNYSMMTADELFSKGRILPYKEANISKTTTLRDELQNNHQEEEEEEEEEEDDADFSLRPPKNPNRWRGFLGLRKPSRKSDKYAQPSSVDKRGGTFHYEDHINVQCSKNSQESVE